nr:response regulator [Acidobacteriota bacterium]
MRVLVVEDEPKLAAFIRKGLLEDQFAVDVAGDGETAVRMAEAARYDLIILDIMLPGMDGFAVCAAVRGRQPDLPILMLSARGLIEDRVQ